MAVALDTRVNNIHSAIILYSIYSAELAAQLYVDELHRNSNTAPTHPPSSLEDYQKAARADHSIQKKLCILM